MNGFQTQGTDCSLFECSLHTLLLGDGINHTHMEIRGPPVSGQLQGHLYFIPIASQLFQSINYPRGPLSPTPTSAASITIGVLLCLFMEVNGNHP